MKLSVIVAKVQRRHWMPLLFASLLVVGGFANADDEPPLAVAQRAVDQGDFVHANAVLSALLVDYPDDLDARFLRARVLSWSNDWPAALADYDKLLQAAPDNVDYLLGKARALLWSGSPENAAAVAREARRLAPDYDETYRVELQALGTIDAPDRRSELKALTAIAQDRFPAAGFELRESNQHYAEISAGFEHQALTGSYEDWESHYVRGSLQFERDASFTIGLQSTRRFGIEDSVLGLRGGFRASPVWTGVASLDLGPRARVLPRNAVALGMRRQLAQGWAVQLGGRYSDYATTFSGVISVDVERYWRSYRFAYSLFRGRAEAADATISHVVRVDRYYGNENSIGLLVATGHESESLGGGRLVNTEVSGLSLVGEHWVGPGWSLQWSLGYHEQGALYRRTGFDVGFRHRH